MKKSPLKTIITILLSLHVISPTVKASTIFNLIANTNTLAPDSNGGGNFKGLGKVAIDNGEVLFFGQDANSTGWFTSKNGLINRVVDSNQFIPGSTTINFGSFLSAPQASISNGQIAFTARFPPARGSYLFSEGQISTTAFRGDPVPDNGPSSFGGFGNSFIDNGTVFTQGVFGNSSSGFYTSTGNGLEKVLDSRDGIAIPGFPGRTFQNLTANDIDNSTLLFTGGSFNATQGIYTSSLNGSISVIADLNTVIPDGAGNFISFDSRFPILKDEHIVFTATGNNGQSGIYLSKNGQLTKIVDKNTLGPDGRGLFVNLSKPVISGERVLFQGSSTGDGFGIFQWEDGLLSTIVDEDDLLDGLLVNQIVQNTLAVDKNHLVFHAVVGGRSSIYEAVLDDISIPEPSPFMLFIGAAFFMTSWEKSNRSIPLKISC